MLLQLRLRTQAILSDSITIPSPDQPLIMRFRNGNIIAFGPIYRPRSFKVQFFSEPGSGKVAREVERKPEEFAFEGGGWHFQADEVARCVRDKRIESAVWGWDKSLLEMETFDEVRKQGGYVFPPGVEQVV